MAEFKLDDLETNQGLLARLDTAIVNGGGVNAVARKIGKNKNTLTRWKAGSNKISLQDLIILADATGVDKIWLAFGEVHLPGHDGHINIALLRRAFDLFVPVALRMTEVQDHESLFEDILSYARNLQPELSDLD